MSSPGRHDPDHQELVSLYALRALPPAEMATAHAQISGCAACRQELEALRPIVDAFTAWPTDVLRPSQPLWDRLARRIAAETGGQPVSVTPQQWKEPAWLEAAPGISCKLLATDPDHGRVSMLVRLAPGTDYPPHRHAGVEELHLLDGELMVDAKKLDPGDYLRSEPGTVDRRVWSETGCTCVLLTSYRDVIL
ncbi:MAG TPA: cupin domain-containing protein [Methylomirabilota bacterium]